MVTLVAGLSDLCHFALDYNCSILCAGIVRDTHALILVLNRVSIVGWILAYDRTNELNFSIVTHSCNHGFIID